MDGMSCQDIPVDKIVDPPVALRPVRTDTTEFGELKRSMVENGLSNSILVRPTADGNYERVEGGHRLTAARELGWETIPAIVRDMDHAQALTAQFSNAVYIPTQRTEYAKQLLRLQKEYPGITMPGLAKIVGKSIRWIQEQLLLNNLQKKIKPMVDRGEISASNAYDLAKLPTHRQYPLLKQAILLSNKQFKPLVAEQVRELLVEARDRNSNRRLAAEECPEFVPTLYGRSFATIRRELVNNREGAAVIAATNPQTLLEAFELGVAWSVHLDPVSVEIQREDFVASYRKQVIESTQHSEESP